MSPFPESRAPRDLPPREWAYVFVVILAALTLAALALAPAEKPEPDAAAKAQKPLDAPALARVWAARAAHDPAFATLAAAVLAGFAVGGGVLGWAVQRLRHGEALLPELPLPEVSWTGWDVAKIAAVYVAAIALMSAFVPGGGPLSERTWPWVADMIARAVTIGVALRVVLRDRNCPPAGLGLTRHRWFRSVRVGFLAFLAFLPCMLVASYVEERVLAALGIEMPQQQAIRIVLGARSPVVLALIGALVLIAAPLSEELFFRGLFQGFLTRRFGSAFGMAASAGVFTLVHGTVRGITGLFLLGLMLAYVYDRTRSLLAPVTLHVVYNGVMLLVVLMLRPPA